MGEASCKGRGKNRLPLSLIPLIFLLTACSGLVVTEVPTPYPTEYLPTVVALTLDAVRTAAPTATPSKIPSATPTYSPTVVPPTPTRTPRPSATPSPLPSPTGPTPTPFQITLPPTPTVTPTPRLANNLVQIRNLGPLSRVTSPLHLYAYLLPGDKQRVKIELLGEDRRLLFREIKIVGYVHPGAMAIVSLDKPFEISALAEAGRLVISTADQYGRLTALNSVPLILLSVGDADISPPADLFNPVLIGEPGTKTLIQGGRLQVTGRARPQGDQPLVVRLVDQQGVEVGMRLAQIGSTDVNGYGAFAAEVTYSVTTPTTVLLQVSQGGDNLQDIIHLSSVEIMLTP